MGKLSTVTVVLDWIRATSLLVWTGIKWVGKYIIQFYNKLRNWLRTHIPFVEGIIQRHLHNPATIFIDIAVTVVIAYVLFGGIGYVNVYKNKSESVFTERLSSMYPLPAVSVDGSYVWSHKFLQRLRFLNTFNAQAPENIADKLPNATELREQIIAGLIEDKIILLEAIKAGIRVTKEELDIAFEEQQKQTKDFEKALKTLYGMSPQEFKQVVAERILKEKVKSIVLTRIKVRHILTSTEAAAKDALAKLKNQESFEQIAQEYSQDRQTKDSGGELGYWTKGELAATISTNFEEIAFKLSVNQLSSPIQTKFGYHLIQITERVDNEFKTYAEWYKEVQAKHQIKIYIPY